jgi:NAD-dependent deacetylase
MRNMQLTDQAISLIRKSERIVAFSGAGISTEAGIPDFRGPGGLWEDDGLVKKLSITGFKRDPEAFYRSSVNLFKTMASAKPTLAHRLLAQLEKLGKMKAVITQNIDGLHQAAGSGNVYEIHGTCCRGHCTKCSAGYDMAGFYSEIENGRLKVPLCSACQAIIKPDVVLFEELLPVNAWEGSVEAAQQCDLMLIFGSSLVVYPAAELPMVALDNGARLVIVNLEPTNYDHMADVMIQEKLGEFAKHALATFI